MEREEIEVGKKYIVEIGEGEKVIEVDEIDGRKFLVADEEEKEYTLRLNKFVKLLPEDEPEEVEAEEVPMTTQAAGALNDMDAKFEDFEDQLEQLEERIARLEKAKKHPVEVVTEVVAEGMADKNDRKAARDARKAARAGKGEGEKVAASTGSPEIQKLLGELDKAKAAKDDGAARKIRKQLRNLGYSMRPKS